MQLDARSEEPDSFESFDGVRIAYRDLGRGPATLLHHGFASDSLTNWIRPGVAAALVEAGRRVILVDARGHGASEKPHDPRRYARGAMQRDARALLDHLGVDEVDAVGYSMGSLVTIEMVLADERIRSMVLGGVGTGQVTVSDPRRAARVAEGLEVEDRSQIEDRTALAFRNFAEATGADRHALAAIQRAGRILASEEELAQVALPTLVVNGERDALVGRLESLAELIP
ncbi:MAG: alpha/beta fold hydrolase, partial [Acidimicrobiales bacterium]